MIQIKGKGNISATIVADSISKAGVRITTFELEYPRFIHSEFMTHRMFSRNAASSRAIPIDKGIEQVSYNPAMPIHWGKNQSGMQAKEEVGDTFAAKDEWILSANDAVVNAGELVAVGLHKQIVNRILEPYQMIKVVCTATEYENFFYLRDHPDAQPEIAELARCMKLAREESKPRLLKAGQWHLPYLDIVIKMGGHYYVCGDKELDPESARKVSASLCAQVSYRKSDESLDKALKIYDQLVTMKPVHASPFEHQATPMLEVSRCVDMPTPFFEGLTHQDMDGNFWSGNFKGWIQNRQLIPNHVYKD